MKYYVELYVSLKETAICVIDGDGAIAAESMVPTEPDAVITFLRCLDVPFHRIGLETGSLATWLCEGLSEADLPVVCMESRHASGILKANR